MIINERVLIVDDDSASRYVKRHMLARAGYDILEAGTGRRGLELLAQDSIALVILDVKLPDMNGLDVCRTIKKDYPTVLVLQTSAAFTSKSDRAAGLAGGADAYLIEPLEPSEFLATIESLLRRFRAEDTLAQAVAEGTQRIAEIDAKLKVEIGQRAEAEIMLMYAQKLDVLGQLTSGISHDFNNILTVILGNVESLRRELGREQPDLAKLRYFADNAAYGVERAAGVTRHLMAFSRRQTLSPEVIDLRDVYTRLMNLIRQVLGERVTVHSQIASDVWPIHIDPGQFETAILNLVVNARDAMPEGGVLRLMAANMPASGPAGEDRVEIKIADTGVGMAPEVQKLVFEPFFTTKDIGQGTGLGLSQVYGFVKQSHGSIEIDSEIGKGTELRIYLPRYMGPCLPESASAVQAIDSAQRGKGARILVVEDDRHVREHSSGLLRELGYVTLEAGTARAGLEFLAANTGVDLVFTDIGLTGGMSGVELGREIAKRYPKLPVVYTSAYATAQLRKEGLKEDAPFVPKPFTLKDVASVLGRSLATFEISGEVLVVEDEPMIRMDLVASLEDLGFRVCEAASTSEARELLDSKNGEIAALVTDMNLPDGTGRDLAQAARRRRIDLPVVFTSGYVDMPPGGPVKDAYTVFLTKPFHPKQVAEVLTELGVRKLN